MDAHPSGTAADEGQSPARAAGECRLQPSRHAISRMLGRGIEEHEIRDIMRRGTKRHVPEVGEDGRTRMKWEIASSWCTLALYLAPCHIFLKTVHYGGG